MSNAQRIVVFDTETTGLTLHERAPLSKQPKIINFGAIVLENGRIVQEESFLVNPQESLTEEIIKITGYHDEDLQDQMPFSEYVPLLRRLFETCGHVMAHNLPFDKTMMRNDLTRINAWSTFPWPYQETCIVGLFKEQYGYNPKLTLLYQDVMGEPLIQKHRALDDAKALVEIILEEELWQLG